MRMSPIVLQSLLIHIIIGHSCTAWLEACVWCDMLGGWLKGTDGVVRVHALQCCRKACAAGGCLQSKCATVLRRAVACRFMQPIDPAAEGALEDPASTYADCRAVVERGLEELQACPSNSLPLPDTAKID